MSPEPDRYFWQSQLRESMEDMLQRQQKIPKHKNESDKEENSANVAGSRSALTSVRKLL